MGIHLKISEAAKYIGVSRGLLLTLDIPHSKTPGGHRRYSRESLDRYLINANPTDNRIDQAWLSAMLDTMLYPLIPANHIRPLFVHCAKESILERVADPIPVAPCDAELVDHPLGGKALMLNWRGKQGRFTVCVPASDGIIVEAKRCDGVKLSTSGTRQSNV